MNNRCTSPTSRWRARAWRVSHEAWDHFVTEFRPVLYRAADAIDRSGRAREVADALYGELYSKALFRYFHGRSSLATWLRSLVSQRYVDRIRETRRARAIARGIVTGRDSGATGRE